MTRINVSFVPQPFLKKGDLTSELAGTPLTDLITYQLDEKKLGSLECEGFFFHKVFITDLTRSIRNKVMEQAFAAKKSLSIKNSKVKLVVYTLCRLDDIV